ncbi:MAG: signal peptide peptidase SppA, partial [Thermoguttaceae bacterium]
MASAPRPEGESQVLITAEVVREAGPRPPQPPRHTWQRFFLALLALVLFGSISLNFVLLAISGLGALSVLGETDRKVQEKYVSHNRSARDKVAIISIEGVILAAEDGFVKHQIDRVMEDENVKAVVLRIDSPGGSISGSDYLYYHLRQLAKKREIPIVVSMGSIAASGGYYVSMAAGDTPDVLFAEPTCFTGSIGVIIPHYDLSALMEKVGAQENSIVSHPLKDMGSMSRPMTQQERKIFQALVDDGFTRFKDIVKSGRANFRKDPAALEKLATGQVFAAEQARRNGLVDQIGFIEDAVDRAIVLANLDKEQVKVVKYKA